MRGGITCGAAQHLGSGAVSGHRDGDQGTRRRKGWGVILPVKTRVKTCQGASRSG